jgi:hypothetical protein
MVSLPPLPSPPRTFLTYSHLDFTARHWRAGGAGQQQAASSRLDFTARRHESRPAAASCCWLHGRPATAGATTMMAKALVRDAPPAAMGLMESAHGLG